jgi:glycosyltransferase involved in cell wall biosynthesis
VDSLARQLGSRSVEYAKDEYVNRWIDRRCKTVRYDVIVGRHAMVLGKANPFGLAPVILDSDDVETKVYEARLSQPQLARWKRAMIRRQLSQTARAVPRLQQQCAHVWVANQSDAAAIRARSISVLPNIPFGGRIAPPDRDGAERRQTGRTVLFVGSMAHRANTEGLSRFLRRCWPQIRARCSDAVLRVVGSGMTRDLIQAWQGIPGVELVGCVDDLSAEYAQCAFTLVPLFEGSGTNIKVLESLLHRRTCVVTRHSLRGYEPWLSDRRELLVTDDDEGFAAGCIALLEHPALCDALATSGQRVVDTTFTWGAFAGQVASTIDRVLGPRLQ